MPEKVRTYFEEMRKQLSQLEKVYHPQEDSDLKNIGGMNEFTGTV